MERVLLFFARYPIDFIAYISSILPIIIGLIHYTYLSRSLKIVWFFFIVSFIKDTYSLILIFTVPNNIYIQNIEPVYQTVMIGITFYYLFDSPINRRLILTFTGICTLITIGYYRNNEVSSISLSAFRVFSIVLVLSYYSKLLTDMRVKTITKHSIFWFTSGLFVYVAGTFFIMLLSEYWYQDINKVPMAVFDKYWNASQLLLILFTLLAAVGLWLSKNDHRNLI